MRAENESVITETPAHSSIMGGSTAEQRIHCPGSMQLEARMPEEPESEYAREGSMLHAAMELIIASDLEDGALEDFIGQDLGFEGLEITADHVELKLRPALKAFNEIVEEYDIDDWFIEQKVSLESIVPGAFGTIDILAKDTRKRLHVLDWKFGDGVVVPVEGSYQHGFYAACALYDEDPELIEFTQDLADQAFFHVVQPRIGDALVKKTWPTTLAWIEKLIDQIERAAKLMLEPEPPLAAGSWCKWCSAKPICGEHRRLASLALSKAPQSMTAVELAEALEMAERLKDWVADVFKLAQREAEDGARVPGWKLVPKMPRRVWTDEKRADTLLQRAGFKVSQRYKPRELISPAQAEKLAKDLYTTKLSSYVESKSSGLTLARESDKREAVVDSVALLANAMTKAGVS